MSITQRFQPRQENFIHAVVSGKTACAAYREAYGCSQKSAEANAARLMEKDGIAAEIDRRLARVAHAVERKAIFTREEMLRRLRAIGLAEIRQEGVLPSFGAQIRALRQAADLMGLRLEPAHNVAKPINLMTAAERRARIAELCGMAQGTVLGH